MSEVFLSKALTQLNGELSLPGDKSISHRRALLSLFTEEEIHFHHFATGDDGQATLDCLHSLGKEIQQNRDSVLISGSLTSREATLNCRNSGTTARLLMGILAGKPGKWILTGDASLSRRPMERVAVPLRMMGADIELTGGCLPARITGRRLRGIQFDSSIASAQVKSAVVFAALNAERKTSYREPFPSRDHTERILSLPTLDGGWIVVDPATINVSAHWLSGKIPGDPSSAAYWVIAALLIPHSSLRMKNVLANPLRTTWINLLQNAGAEILWENQVNCGSEESATLNAITSDLCAFSVCGKEAVADIDEVPILAVAASQAQGISFFSDLDELRVKESNRLQLIVDNLKRMGGDITENVNGFSIRGKTPLKGAIIETNGDHRIAMAFAVAALIASGQSVIKGAECVGVSYPEFWKELTRLLPECLTYGS